MSDRKDAQAGGKARTPPADAASHQDDPAAEPDFTRSAAAAANLAGALRNDAGAATRRAGARLSALAGRARNRLRGARRTDRHLRSGEPDHSHSGGAAAVPAAPASRRRFPWLKAIAANFVLGVVAVVALFWWALRDVPWAEIADGSLEPVVVLESFDGEPIVSQGPYQDAFATLDQFPQHLIDAVISTEDRRFFEHSGIDLRGIARAFLRNLWAGEVVQGGSTITQQLVKIRYLERERTYKRKLQEMVIAFWLESRLSKDEILARYLNNIYLGAGATGVPAAARIYFDKAPFELDLAESALLAGIIRAPSHLSPLTNPEGAQRRAATVLNAMVASGRLEEDEARAAASEFAELNPTTPAVRSGSWFADWVMEDAREIAGPYRGTITVRTTLVPALQELAEEAVSEVLTEQGAAADATQAALVAMRPDGAVVAMVGGIDYEESEFNRAVDAMRQPGSTFKLFVYYAALKAGISLRDRVVDAPMEIDGWSPENFGGDYSGPVSVAEAFARSLNAATVALALDVGIDEVVEAARELGIDAELSPTPALALGASEVSLIDLTGAYASVRAGVAPVEPWGIESFQADDQGRTFRIGPSARPDLDVSAHQDELVTLLQLAVERGTGQNAAFGAFAAGKTGTSQNYRDAWFIGFSGPLVVGVWVGNDNDSPMNEVTGGKLPAELWSRFMEGAIHTAPPPGEEAEEVVASEEGAAPVVACNVRACQRAYRSFRASDCTFQPYDGPRKLCER